jgi:hypothetical protein
VKTYRPTIWCPVALRRAINRARRVVIDLETTGLTRNDRIVAVGVLVGRQSFILLTEHHLDLSGLRHQLTWDQIREALSPLG